MSKTPGFDEQKKLFEDEIDEVISLLPEGEGADRNSVITAGLFAKLDLILDGISMVSSRLRIIENKLYEDSRIITWINTLKKK